MTNALIAVSPTPTRSEALGPLAFVFYKQVLGAGREVDPEGIVAVAAALLMKATVDGHICLTPDEIEERAKEVGLAEVAADALRDALKVHPWVGTGDGTAPLVWENDRLYLRRFREAEKRLAAGILARVAKPPTDQLLSVLGTRFREIFPPSPDTDWQAVAATACLRSQFALITGGPGTGKTATVARLLLLLYEQNPNFLVALAAPTGKAASRLSESIRQTWDSMGIDSTERERLPTSGSTLHRLLGYRPQDDSFRRTERDPLEHDVIIVDEASMVPLLLMDTLFAAARPDARIILLGDHGQLASVEAGSVLADLVAASGALDHDHGPSLATAYATLSGLSLPSDPSATPLRDAVVRLVKNYRFDDSKGVGAFARAIRDGDSEAAMDVLKSSDPSVVHASKSAEESAWMDAVAEPANAVFSSSSPDTALSELGRIRVLCATNVGPAGTIALTRRIEERLRKHGNNVTGQFYRGRPLLLTRNDYALGLFNGDVGVVWDTPGEDGTSRARAFIASSANGEQARGYSVLQLPGAVTAWAMSVHKAQGSEFDTAVVVLPDIEMEVLSRELLYTAVSRAKKCVVMVGSEAVIRFATGRTARRGSGLALRLNL